MLASCLASCYIKIATLAGFHIDIFCVVILSVWLSVFTVLFPELCYLIIRKHEKGFHNNINKCSLIVKY